MAFEYFLLVALIIIFIVSFCGLIQKIRQTYEHERRVAARIAENRNEIPNNLNNNNNTRNVFALSDVYVNQCYVGEAGLEQSGIYPSAAPPYSRNYNYSDPPPKYDDIIKSEEQNNDRNENNPQATPITIITQS